MNALYCPECDYPNPDYKGMYNPDCSCGMCGYIETNQQLIQAYRAVRKNIDERYGLERNLEIMVEVNRRMRKGGK